MVSKLIEAAALVLTIGLSAGVAHANEEVAVADPNQWLEGVEDPKALEWVKAQGRAAGQDITLGALRGSDANRFYLRHGFRLVEEQEFDLEYRWSPEFDARTAEVAP